MNQVEYPQRPNEAEVQFELCKLLRSDNVDAKLQVKGRLNGRRARFDIAIFLDQEAVAIIECKSWRRYHEIPTGEKQLYKYMQWGLPVFICGRIEHIPRIRRAVANVLAVRTKKVPRQYPTPPLEEKKKNI